MFENNKNNPLDKTSKQLILQSAIKVFNKPYKHIDKNTLDTAKEVLNEVEQWELENTDKQYSVLKNDSILVAYLGYKFGETIGLDKNSLEKIYIAGLIHDIGKKYITKDSKQAYQYINSPLKPGDKGFEEILEALKTYPQQTEKYLKENTNLDDEIIDLSSNYHSVYSNIFKGGYPNTDKNITELDTVLWFADSLSAISFSNLPELHRNYARDREITLLDAYELLKSQTQNIIPEFWDKSNPALMGIMLAMFIASTTSPSDIKAAEFTSQEVVSLVNEHRKVSGLIELEEDNKLSQAAIEKAKDMFERDYWAHYAPDGTTPWQFIEQEGYRFMMAGENLAKGYDDPKELLQAWLDSPTHRYNIEKPEFDEIGVAVMDGNLNGKKVTLVVQMFAQEQPEVTPEPTQAEQPEENSNTIIDAVIDFLEKFKLTFGK